MVSDVLDIGLPVISEMENNERQVNTVKYVSCWFTVNPTSPRLLSILPNIRIELGQDLVSTDDVLDDLSLIFDCYILVSSNVFTDSNKPTASLNNRRGRFGEAGTISLPSLISVAKVERVVG